MQFWVSCLVFVTDIQKEIIWFSLVKNVHQFLIVYSNTCLCVYKRTQNVGVDCVIQERNIKR